MHDSQDIIELRASQWQVLPAAAAASGEESEHREPLASTVATASEVGVLEETNTDTKVCISLGICKRRNANAFMQEYPARRPDEPEQQPEQTEHKSVERQEENTSGEHAEAEETPRFDREAKGKGRAKEDEEREEEERVREGQESVKWEGMEPESEPKGAEPIVRITADAELGTDVTRAEVESEVVNGGQIAAEAEDAAATGQDALSPTDSPRFTWGGSLPSAVSKHSSRHSVSDTTSERPEHPFCDLLHPIPAQRFGDAAPLTAFASVRIIEDLNTVPYPATIERPNPDLNIGTIPGKFRYEPDDFAFPTGNDSLSQVRARLFTTVHERMHEEAGLAACSRCYWIESEYGARPPKQRPKARAPCRFIKQEWCAGPTASNRIRAGARKHFVGKGRTLTGEPPAFTLV